MHELWGILLDILLPILVLVGLGIWMRRQFQVDLATLAKINIYLFVPGFIFEKVSTSTLPWADMGGVVVVTVVQVAILGAIVWGLGRMLRVSRQTLAAVAIAVMFYNSGNFGLPLAELAYPGRSRPASVATSATAAPSKGSSSGLVKDGGAVQAFVAMTQNLLTFTVGLTIAAAAGTQRWTAILGKIFRLPVIYVLVSALLTRAWTGGDPSRLPRFIARPAEYLAAGLVPVALITLGAQIAANSRWPRWRRIWFVLVLRLLGGPVQMIAILLLFHVSGIRGMDLWPWPAELLILTAATPTAVNTLLLTLELGGDAELAADCVFWTTITSCMTLLGWLLLLRVWF